VQFRIWIYCPDRHLKYDGTTPDGVGVGGGVTARIRVAEALAALGHEVRMACNCLTETSHAGVTYLPLDAVSKIDADVVVLHTSGGGLDLTPYLSVEAKAKLQILFLSGTEAPKGALDLKLDSVYVPSNFVREAVSGVFPRTFLTHHGVVRRIRLSEPQTQRDPHRLIYASHPSKGLQPAIEVWKLLRVKYPDSELHVCGGNRLWGGTDDPPASSPGLFYHGLMGQDALSDQYAKATFALHLQNRLEPFGLTLIESMAMGCIPLASPVGAFAELVQHEWNGLSVYGNAEDPATHRHAAELLQNLTAQEIAMMQRRAIAAPLSWEAVASMWIDHWCSLLMPGRLN
jgi:glycosyltransferase involved in cell wall biosynthesis